VLSQLERRALPAPLYVAVPLAGVLAVSLVALTMDVSRRPPA
jgi:hypothetical protein